MDDLPLLYWRLAISILSIGAVVLLFTIVMFYRMRRTHHPITKAFLLQLIPNMLVVVNFLPIHTSDLIKGRLEQRAWCQVSAVQTITSVVACNFGAGGCEQDASLLTCTFDPLLHPTLRARGAARPWA